MRRRIISSLVGAAATVTAADLFRRYRRDLRGARQRTLAGARVIDTSAGPVEFAEGGEGPAVLVVHGAGGGHDQGMLVARMIGGNFRWIAPSRFGYLRTPQREEHSPETQAAAHAALLDALDVPAAAVIGMSAGAPSALMFAARYRDRCRGVVSFAGLTRGAPPRPRLQEALFRYGLRLNSVYWVLGKAARNRVRRLIGAPPELVACLTAKERVWLDEFLDSFLPVAPRYEGLIADMVMGTTEDFLHLPLEEVSVPVRAFQARDDTVLPYSMLQYLSEYIPHAKTTSFEDGGHLLLGHHEEVASAVRDFLHETVDRAGPGR